MQKDIIITTKDGVMLHASYVEVGDMSAPTIILLHMMPATKESWSGFQKRLASAGLASLAVDLRGHGESVIQDGKRINSRNFSDAEHQQSIYDVEAVVDFFISKGVSLENISFVGASIGANLALQYQKEHAEIKASVLLSAGLNYKGIETEPFVKEMQENQGVFLVGAKEDMRKSGESCAQIAQILFDISGAINKRIAIFDGSEHGTDLFDAHPKLADDIIVWLKNIKTQEH